MPLQQVGLLDNPLAAPTQLAEVHRHGNRRKPARGRGTTAHSQRNPVIHPQRQRHNRASLLTQHAFVDLKNQIVLKPRAAFSVAPRSRNRELRGRRCFNLQIKIQRNGHGVESRPKVG